MDVPGTVKEELDVGPGPIRGTISIRARGREIKDAVGQPLMMERSPRPGGAPRFTRVVPVGPDADVSRCKPELKDGVLVVTIPKVRPGEEKRP